MKIKSILSLFACFAIACGFTGCATSGAAGTSTTSSAPSAATVDQNLLQFAETAQNVVQTVNSGVAILAPTIDSGVAIAGLVATSPKQQAVLSKITSVTAQVSTIAAKNGLPPTSVQAAVSAVNTPATAVAIVQQVQAGQ